MLKYKDPSYLQQHDQIFFQALFISLNAYAHFFAEGSGAWTDIPTTKDNEMSCLDGL